MSEIEPTEIDPGLEHRLRVAVERVVRPVGCEELRKTRMRNELLGHARDRFEEGVRRGLDPERAAGDAIDRMGDPAELTAELRATVPLADRWAVLVDWTVRRKPGTPHWRHAAWMGALAGGGIVALLVLSGAITACFAPKEKVFGQDALRAMLWLGCSFTLIAAIATYFGGRVRDRMAVNGNRLDTRAIGHALAGGALALIGGLVAWTIVGAPAVLFSPTHGACWAALSLTLTVSMPALAWLDIRERREIEPWLALEVD